MVVGHNAVGFLLTAGVIGMNYYFIPKVADRPIYSYRLSIIHFWVWWASIPGWYTPSHLQLGATVGAEYWYRDVVNTLASILGWGV